MRTYLTFSSHLAINTLLFFFLVSGSAKLFLLLLISYGAMFVLFHKKKLMLEKMMHEREVVVSPISGDIIQIKHNYISGGKGSITVIIKMELNHEKGLYFPAQGELTEMKAYFPRMNKNVKQEWDLLLPKKHLYLSFLTTVGEKISIEFRSPKAWGGIPRLMLMPGDKGMASARMGCWYFGGMALIYLPENYTLLVKEGDRVEGGESIIAGHNMKSLPKHEETVHE